VTSQQQPDPSDAVGAAGLLADALNGLSARLDAVKRDSEDRDKAVAEASKRRDKKQWVAIGIDIVLTIALAVLAWQFSNVSTRADSATASAAAATASESALHAAQISGCVAGNQERAGELALWTYLFDATKPTSEAQAEAVDKFMAIVRSTFAARNCQSAYPLPKGEAGGTG